MTRLNRLLTRTTASDWRWRVLRKSAAGIRRRVPVGTGRFVGADVIPLPRVQVFTLPVCKPLVYLWLLSADVNTLMNVWMYLLTYIYLCNTHPVSCLSFSVLKCVLRTTIVLKQPYSISEKTDAQSLVNKQGECRARARGMHPRGGSEELGWMIWAPAFVSTTRVWTKVSIQDWSLQLTGVAGISRNTDDCYSCSCQRPK